MTTTKDTTEFTLAQVVQNLRDVEERLRGAFGYPAVTGPQVERIARIVASALVIIEARFDTTDKAVDLLAKLIDRHGEQIEQLNLESCNRVSTARAPLEMIHLHPPGSLLDLLADCQYCGGPYEIVEIGGCNSPITHHARCGDPTCPIHNVYVPVSAETARQYEDRLAAEEAGFGVQREAQP